MLKGTHFCSKPPARQGTLLLAHKLFTTSLISVRLQESHKAEFFHSVQESKWPQVFLGVPSPSVSPVIPAQSLTHSFLVRCIKVTAKGIYAWYMAHMHPPSSLLLLECLKQQLLSVRCAEHNYDGGFICQSLVSHFPKMVQALVGKMRLLFTLLKQFIQKKE